MISNNKQGVAILMVLSTITLLSVLMFSFKFETSINKIKAYNSTSKTQARLNAESGLNLAMARLEIYQNALNELSKNPNLKQFAKPDILNQIWSLPLKFPIPVTSDMSISNKNALGEFEKELLLNGEVITSIENISNKINLNSLRQADILKFLDEYTSRLKKPAPPKNPNNQDDNPQKPPEQEDSSQKLDEYVPPENETEKPKKFQEIEARLKELIQAALQSKRDTDSYFFNKYSGIEVDELIAVIKYYVSDEGADIGPFGNQVASDFEKLEITPKFAPLSSLSELYLLPVWTDELIGLIKNEITVHGGTVIDINKITINLLRLIIPDITDQQAKAFFDYKNNAEIPVVFESEQDLVKYFVDEVRLIEQQKLEERFKILSDAGIYFSSGPNLFKIISTGKFDNSTYTINAIINIGRTESKKQTNTANNGGGGGAAAPTPPNNKDQLKSYEYSRPRILEIYIN